VKIRWGGLGLAVALAAAAASDGGVTGRAPARTLSEVKLLYFHATWCGGCKRLEAGKVLERLQALQPALVVERIDIDAQRPLVERYGVEYTPTLLLVDADGFPLGKPRIELADPDATLERLAKLVRKATGP